MGANDNSKLELAQPPFPQTTDERVTATSASIRNQILKTFVPFIIYTGMVIFSSIRDYKRRGQVDDNKNDHLISLLMLVTSLSMVLWLTPWLKWAQCFGRDRNGRHYIQDFDEMIVMATSAILCGFLVYSTWEEWVKYISPENLSKHIQIAGVIVDGSVESAESAKLTNPAEALFGYVIAGKELVDRLGEALGMFGNTVSDRLMLSVRPTDLESVNYRTEYVAV